MLNLIGSRGEEILPPDLRCVFIVKRAQFHDEANAKKDVEVVDVRNSLCGMLALLLKVGIEGIGFEFVGDDGPSGAFLGRGGFVPGKSEEVRNQE